MSDERVRELKRRWRETGTSEDGDLYVREIMRSHGVDNMFLVKHLIRLEWAVREAAAATQPQQEMRSFGRQMFARLTEEVPHEIIITYLTTGDVLPAPPLHETTVVGDELDPETHWAQLGISQRLYIAIWNTLGHRPPTTYSTYVFNYYHGRLQVNSGDLRMELSAWITLHGSAIHGVCDVAHCQFAALVERCDGRARCAYHYNPRIQCADESCERTITAQNAAHMSSGWRVVPGSEDANLMTCPTHSQYTGDPRLTVGLDPGNSGFATIPSMSPCGEFFTPTNAPTTRVSCGLSTDHGGPCQYGTQIAAAPRTVLTPPEQRCTQPYCENPVDTTNPDCVAYNLCSDCQLAA